MLAPFKHLFCFVLKVLSTFLVQAFYITTITCRLKKELESANDLLAAHRGQELSQEQLAEMCPTAALTSKFIKSGMTLTQVQEFMVICMIVNKYFPANVLMSFCIAFCRFMYNISNSLTNW